MYSVNSGQDGFLWIKHYADRKQCEEYNQNAQIIHQAVYDTPVESQLLTDKQFREWYALQTEPPFSPQVVSHVATPDKVQQKLAKLLGPL